MDVVEFLSRNHIIKWFISLGMHTTRYLNAINKDYHKLCKRSRATMVSERNLQNRKQDLAIHTGSKPVLLRVQLPQADQGQEERQKMWDGLPRMPFLLDFYQLFSTQFMILTLIKNLLPDESIVQWLQLEKPLNCYLPGRFILHPSLSKMAVISSCIFHLSRRAWLKFHEVRFLSVFAFIVQSVEDVRLQLCLAKSCDDKDHKMKEPGSVDFILHHVMFYPVKRKRRTLYRLRPNRTIDHHAKIARVCAIFIICISSVLLLSTIVIFLVLMKMIVFDPGYLAAYPGCTPELDDRLARHGVSEWDLSLDWYRVYVATADSLTCWVSYFDSGCALLVVPMANFYNYDILLYWRQTHERLENLLVRLKLNHFLEQEAQKIPYVACNHYCTNDQYFQHYLAKQMRINLIDISLRHGSSGKDSNRSATDMSRVEGSFKTSIERDQLRHPRVSIIDMTNKSTQTPELEDLINEMQHEVCDLFRQIQAVDSIISDIITENCIMWTLMYATLSYGSVTLRVNGYTTGPAMFQAMAFMIFIFSGYQLIELNRRLTKSYGVICSIMAYDKSRYKRKFLSLVEYFTVQQRACYTLFHTYPYSSTALLAVIGYTISVTIIYENLFLRPKYG